jgi:hypothetical protein
MRKEWRPNTTLQPPSRAARSIQIQNGFSHGLRLNVEPLGGEDWLAMSCSRAIPD